MPTRIQMIFNVSTTPLNLASARVHAGSFTEGFWITGAFDGPALVNVDALAQVRARFLPGSAAITGYRATAYEIVNGRAMPGATQAGRLNRPGAVGLGTDIPQMALSVRMKSAGKANVSKFHLHCIPDGMIEGGEFIGGLAETGLINPYLALMVGRYSFLGRNRALPKFQINDITGGVLTVDGSPAWVVGDTIRLLRVRDQNNRPIRGAYRVGVAGLHTFTLVGFPADIVVKAVGQVRKETVELFPMSSYEVGRASTRKIGRPSEAYRGRAARR